SDRDFNITAAGGTIVVDHAIAGTLNGVISGDGALIVSGDSEDISSLTLTGNNTYQGGTTIQNDASLGISDDQQLGDKAGNIKIDNATLSLNGNVTSDRAITVTGQLGGTLWANPDTTSTFNGNITGSGRLVVDGSGTVILTHSNDYQGGTVIA